MTQSEDLDTEHTILFERVSELLNDKKELFILMDKMTSKILT